MKVFLPDSLKILKFGKFYSPLISSFNIKLPSLLEYLNFGNYFYAEIKTELPKSLKHLILGGWYNHEIKAKMFIGLKLNLEIYNVECGKIIHINKVKYRICKNKCFINFKIIDSVIKKREITMVKSKNKYLFSFKHENRNRLLKKLKFIKQ